jgi:hypothetical protein
MIYSKVEKFTNKVKKYLTKGGVLWVKSSK